MNRFDASMLWDTVADSKADGFESHASDSDSLESESSDAGDQPGFSEMSGVDTSDVSDGSFTTEASEAWQASQRAQTFFVPLHYEQNYRYPLIVWLHSDGFNENQITQLMPHVSTRNYLATGIRGTVAMDAAGHRFQWGNSRAATKAAERSVLRAIDRVARDYSVHAQRIVLAGYRSGGTMALKLAMQNPDLFSAAISLGGELDPIDRDLIDVQLLRERRLPMLWQWSLESDHYAEEQLVDGIKSAQAIRSQLEIRQYKNDDEMNTVVLSDLNQWIMNHVVCGAAVGKMESWDTGPTTFSNN